MKMEPVQLPLKNSIRSSAELPRLIKLANDIPVLVDKVNPADGAASEVSDVMMPATARELHEETRSLEAVIARDKLEASVHEGVQTALARLQEAYELATKLAGTYPEIAQFIKEHTFDGVATDIQREEEEIVESISGISPADQDHVDAHEQKLSHFIETITAKRDELLDRLDKALTVTQESLTAEKEKIEIFEGYNPEAFPASFELFAAILVDDEKRKDLITYVNGRVAAYVDIANLLIEAAKTDKKLERELKRIHLAETTKTVVRRQKINVSFLEDVPNMGLGSMTTEARYTNFKQFMDYLVPNIGHLTKWKYAYIDKKKEVATAVPEKQPITEVLTPELGPIEAASAETKGDIVPEVVVAMKAEVLEKELAAIEEREKTLKERLAIIAEELQKIKSATAS